MSARRLDTALRQCRLALESSTLRPLPTQSHRAFSTTAPQRKNGSLPVFTETPNADLNALLSKIRNTIFLPSHLRQAQRKLIHRTRHHALLRAEPFMVDLGDESIQLQPLNPTKDVPDSWAAVLQALDLMKQEGSAAGWAHNLVGLLAGMHTAGRRWKGWQVEKIVRVAGEAGMAHAVLEAVRASGRTGLVLRELRVVREVLWACRTKAMLGDWGEEEVERGLKYAEQIARLLEEEVHWGKLRAAAGTDPRIQPDVIAVLLEMAGQKAFRYHNGKDVDGKVLAYTQRLMANLERGIKEEVEQGRVVSHANYELTRWIPVLNGLRLAQKVLGNAMPQADLAKRKISELEPLVQRYGQTLIGAQESGKAKRRGLVWAEDLERSA